MLNTLQLVENQSEQDNLRVGKQIRDLRKANGLTLIELADKINKSVGYLSQVERGVSTLSILVLQAIAEVFDVSVTWFFHTDRSQTPEELDTIVRADARRHLDFYGTGIREELLSPRLSGEILMIKTILEPQASTQENPRQRKGKEEAGYIESGKLEFTLGKKHYQLKTGDSFSIIGDEPHTLFNPSNTKEAVIIWVISGSY